jgi:uncharacterized repeat protein (TIGR02543 family)
MKLHEGVLGMGRLRLRVLVSGLLTLAILATGGFYLAQHITNNVKAAPVGCLAGTLGELNSCLTTGTAGDDITITITDNIDITATININSNRNITLQSDDPTSHTLNLATTNQDGINIAAGNNLTLTDITLNGTNSARSLIRSYGAGTSLTLNSGAIIQNHTATVNSHSAIAATNSSLTLNINDGAIIRHNSVGDTAFVHGGAIHINNASADPAVININGGQIYANHASGMGGVIYARYNTEVNISGGVIGDDSVSHPDGNYSMAYGSGAIAFDSSNAAYPASLNISGGEITGNYTNFTTVIGQHGGGVSVGNYTDVNISGGEISHNTAYGNGGGIYVSGANSSFTMSGGTISHNIATQPAGTLAGGAMLTGLKTIDITGGTFDSNSVIAMSGGNYVAQGGGLFINNQPAGSTYSVSGITLTNNRAISSGTGGSLGGGMFINSNLITSLNNITATGNEAYSPDSTTAGNGGGIHVTSTALIEMKNTHITDNYAKNHAGGIFFGDYASGFVISGSQITNNTTENGTGGGIYQSTSGSSGNLKKLTLTNTNVTDNRAGISGGGLFLPSFVDVTLDGYTHIDRNKSGQAGNSSGGGLYAGSSTQVLIQGNTTVNGNRSGRLDPEAADILDPNATVLYTGNGGGISMGNGTATDKAVLTITGSATVNDNEAVNAAGGVAIGGVAGEVHLTGNGKVNNNTARASYGGVSLANGNGTAGTEPSFTMTDSFEISGNRAGNNGGGIYLGNYAVANINGDAKITYNKAGLLLSANGGGISMGNYGSLTIGGDAMIDHNFAGRFNIDGDTSSGVLYSASGGGMSVAGSTVTIGDAAAIFNNTATGQGGGVYAGGSLYITGGTITYNTSNAIGGGVMANGNNTVLDISGGEISHNTAGTMGGGLYLNQQNVPVTISDATFRGNEALAGAGGGLYFGNGTPAINISDSVISENEASGTGGGLYLGQRPSVTISGTVFNKNIAGMTGGGINANGVANLSLDGVRLTGNEAGTNGGGLMSNSGSVLDIMNSEIVGNTASGQGGGLGLKNNLVATLDGDTLVSGNTAVNGGGIMANDGVQTNIVGDSVVSDNHAVVDGEIGGFGGAYYSNNLVATLTVADRAKLTANTASFDGGAVYILGNYVPSGFSVVFLEDAAEISGNVAGVNGGAVWMPYAHLDKLDVGSGVVFSGNAAGEFDPSVAPVDLPVYNAHVLVPNSEWSVNPDASVSFLRGYNNYDISYTAVKFDVAFDLNGGVASDGSATIPNEIIYHSDTALEPETPTRAGYTFLGWYLADQPYNFANIVTENLTLTAEWELIPIPTPPFTPNVPNTGLFGLSKEATASILSTIIVMSIILLIITIRHLKRDLKTRNQI